VVVRGSETLVLPRDTLPNLHRGDYQQVLATTYATVVKVDADPAQATDEDWQVVAVYAIATAYTGEPTRAVDIATAAYRHLLESRGPYGESTMAAQRALAVAQLAAHDVHAALRNAAQAHALYVGTHGEHAAVTLDAAADLATCLHRSARCTEGVRLMQSTVDQYVSGHGHDPTSIGMLARLGAMMRDCGQFDRAHHLLGQARHLARTLLPPGDGLLTAITRLSRAGADASHACTADRQPAGALSTEVWLAAMRDPEPTFDPPVQPAGDGSAASEHRPGEDAPAPSAAPAASTAMASPSTVPPVARAKTVDSRQGTMTIVSLLSRPAHGDRQLRDWLRRPLSGPRQITVVNPKGGTGKTVATLMLGLTFGRARGGQVLAWDNNETQGTLGLRAEPGDHERTVRDLLRDLHRFTSREGGSAVFNDYVRGQAAARFDVLASDEAAAVDAMLTARAFRDLRDVITRFYKLIIVDTGNNVRADNWRAAIDATDQLVVTVRSRHESAETAARMLDHLDLTDRRELVRRAVIVVTEAPQRGGPEHAGDLRFIETHFQARCRAVLRVPYDRHLDSGASIRHQAIAASSRRSWLRVAAAVMTGL
jgi:MinD-like ATPase involved in chromosome partitioning or flagellar assembly